LYRDSEEQQEEEELPQVCRFSFPYSKMEKMNKKGVLGLNLVKSVFIIFLVLAVLAVAVSLALSSIKDASLSIARSGVPIGINETLSSVDEIGEYPSGLDKLVDCQLTITLMVNDTDDAVIASSAYTNTNCRIQASGAGTFNNTDWVVTGTYDYAIAAPTLISGNITAAQGDFFANTGTIYAILIVVVIILAIAIVIVIIQRFGGGGTGGGLSGGFGKRTRTPGSDTVMGI
jgi:hypothetical protein